MTCFLAAILVLLAVCCPAMSQITPTDVDNVNSCDRFAL